MLYKKNKYLFGLLGPTILITTIFLYYPFVVNIFDSLFNIKGLAGKRNSFIGLDNYINMLTDATMATALKNTFIIMIATIIFQVGLSLILALMVDSIKLGQKFFKTVYFFPIVISATAIGLMFNLFQFGI